MRKPDERKKVKLSWTEWAVWLLGIWLISILLLAGCRKETTTPPPPTDTVTLPTNTPHPTPTPREQQQPTATETPLPTEEVIQPTGDLLPLPDFSSVRLIGRTYLEDPQYFQVILDGWPQDVPEDIVVRVGHLIYLCQRLFPDRYPNRAYCWGDAPPEGANVLLDVFSDRVADPLVEIPFTVPYIPRETATPRN